MHDHDERESIERLLHRMQQSQHDHHHHVKESLAMLTKEVQDLVDAVAAQGVQITASDTAMVDLEAQVAALQAQIAALPAAGASAEDVAAIVATTATVAASVDALKAVMPAPVAPPVVAAVV